MESPITAYFLNSDNSFLELNTNILETNLVNILLLFIIIYYAIKKTLNLTLEKRKVDIVIALALAQKELLESSSYYRICIENFRKSCSLLEFSRISASKKKLDTVLLKHSIAQQKFFELFLETESLFKNFEKKTFLIMQRYIMLTVACKIMRKFLILSKEDQSQFLQKILSKLGGAD